ncbi:cation:proton antiporter [Macrococcus armenti]|uniref:cation:proton antiporter n=1 Tax=Macrococcus armenti TaxID=2875764 RepID=UPI001CC99026|nr:sodium:proton antiporter [Macrococcus armenti]UBH15875.1 sodium:proton antiporter [Macrococcus armenti]UBH18235.1 sodium:proton antiporter [Macrococcus armenti]UBH20501.1 sodium:proton antiporter [Macrococcus armenti]
MENFIIILSLVFAVIISTVVHFYFPKVPLAFIQIGVGLLIFLTPIPLDVEFEPELFLIGIIAPLLFLEGYHVSRLYMIKYLKPIILMALGLVFTTVIGLGYITHSMLPFLPIAACFAIAAIICPTDAVAVQAIAKNKKLPRGLMTILEGESLLNDAAGILSFNIALVALTTGQFSVSDSISKFFISSIGGLIIGLVIGLIFVQIRVQLVRKGFENEYVFILIQLLTPFVIYMAAESIHVSGVIAAVIGGIVHGIERDRLSQATTRLQLGYNNTWGLLSTVLNGFVFTLLGYLIPQVTLALIEHEHTGILSTMKYMFIIAILVYVFRFIWVFALYNMFYIPESRFERVLKHEDVNTYEVRPNRFKYALIATVCGVHGTISMAIALTIPLEIMNGEVFNYRDNLLFITAGVVVISLIVAQVCLPLLTKTDDSESEQSHLNFKEAYLLIKEFGMKYIHKQTTPENSMIAGNLIRQYTMQVGFYSEVNDRDYNPKEFERLHSIALETEMKTLDELVEQGEISQSAFNNYVQYIERTKIFASTSFFKRLFFLIRMHKRRKSFVNRMNQASSLSLKNSLLEIQKIASRVHYNVVQRLSEEVTKDNRIEIALVSDNYLNRVNQIKRNATNEKIDDDETLFALDVLAAEKDMIVKLVNKGKVSREVAVELRQALNYDEMMLLDMNE